MIRNEVKLIGRLTANPELKYTKETNKALCNVVLAVNSIHKKQEEYQMIHDALCADEDLPF